MQLNTIKPAEGARHAKHAVAASVAASAAAPRRPPAAVTKRPEVAFWVASTRWVSKVRPAAVISAAFAEAWLRARWPSGLSQEVRTWS